MKPFIEWPNDEHAHLCWAIQKNGDSPSAWDFGKRTILVGRYHGWNDKNVRYLVGGWTGLYMWGSRRRSCGLIDFSEFWMILQQPGMVDGHITIVGISKYAQVRGDRRDFWTTAVPLPDDIRAEVIARMFEWNATDFTFWEGE